MLINSLPTTKDGIPKGRYVILTLNENVTTEALETIGVELGRLDYDVEEAAKAVKNSPLPNEFADILRKAN